MICSHSTKDHKGAAGGLRRVMPQRTEKGVSSRQRTNIREGQSIHCSCCYLWYNHQVVIALEYSSKKLVVYF